MSRCPGAHLEHATLLASGRIDPGRCQPLGVCVTSRGIDDMEGLLTAHEPLLDERQQPMIFFLTTVKERADMPRRTQHGAREPHGLCACTPRVPSRLVFALVWGPTGLVGGVHRVLLLGGHEGCLVHCWPAVPCATTVTEASSFLPCLSPCWRARKRIHH